MLFLVLVLVSVGSVRSVRAQTLQILHSFKQNGIEPTGLIVGPDGALYGSTTDFEPGLGSSAYRFEPDEGAKTFRASLDTSAAELIDSGSSIYVATSNTLYRYDQADGFRALSLFHEPCSTLPPCPPLRLTAYDGIFYGVAAGLGPDGPAVIFEYDPELSFGNIFKVFEFDGTAGLNVLTRLTNLDGALYGTTSEGGTHGRGTLFRFEPGSGVTILYEFDSANGAEPSEPMTVSNGSLYGVTSRGGMNDDGTIFRYEPGRGLATLFQFDGSSPSSGLVAYGGSLYGTTGAGPNDRGTLYRYDPGEGVTTLHIFRDDDGTPTGALVARDGALFGTTLDGGTAAKGTIYRYDFGIGLTTVYSFPHVGDDGAFPTAGLLESDGAILGVTSEGGEYNQGTVFRLEPGVGFTTIHSFEGTDGARPETPLIEVGGSYYGATTYGGAAGMGTIFEYEPGVGLKTICAFDGSHGSYPYLLVESAGSFFGATRETLSEPATIFRWDPHDGITTLVSGIEPETLMVSEGSLYGTTALGGSFDWGTLFRYDSRAGFTTLYSFDNGYDGGIPVGDLIEKDGILYGTTSHGGWSDGGTLFRYDPATGLEVLTSFDATLRGARRSLGFVDGDGSIYGTTRSTIFRYDPHVVRKMKTLYSFYDPHGNPNPPTLGPYSLEGRIIRIGDWLYGVSSSGGNSGAGLLYRLSLKAARRARTVQRP